MSKYIIKGGNKLNGVISIDSCKNAILPIMSASILSDKLVKIKNCPKYSDVLKMCNILKKLGSKIIYRKKTLIIDNSNISYNFIDNSLTQDIRASIFTLGPMLARFKKAKLSYPGGCAIGQRGINLHTLAFKELGVEILEQHGYLFCKTKNVKPKTISLSFPSVGATENLMMFMCAINGKFKITNAAKEPEIVDLANFLNKMGAKVSGAGTNEITIIGVNSFKQIEYTPIPDRIIAGSYMIAVAITGGEVKLKNCCYDHVKSLGEILVRSGCEIKKNKKSLIIKSNGKLMPINKVETSPYPDFPTDLQSQLTVMCCFCTGVSIVKENIFECRFRYVPELIKMGANIEVFNNMAIITGKENLSGAEVFATDLRGGIALVIAGLKASGYTTVNDIHFIERGYYNLEHQLKLLGADINKIN